MGIEFGFFEGGFSSNFPRAPEQAVRRHSPGGCFKDGWSKLLFLQSHRETPSSPCKSLLSLALR